MVGYAAGKGGYWLFDCATRAIITSHDVIFNKEIGHCSLTVIEEADDPLSTTPRSTPEDLPGLLTPHQPVAPQICDDAMLHELIPPAN